MVLTNRFETELNAKVREAMMNSIVSNNTATFATGGYIPMGDIVNTTVATNSSDVPMYTYTTASPIIYAADNREKSTVKPNAEDIAEALFTLTPKLRKKFKTHEALIKALLAAAEERFAMDSLDKLREPLGLDR